MNWSPHVAVVTMISTDHLDWHGSEANYIASKRNIIRFQKPGDFLVVDPTNSAARPFTETPANLIPIAKEPRFPLQLAGEHNQFNAQAAFAAASIFGIDWQTAQNAVAN